MEAHDSRPNLAYPISTGADDEPPTAGNAAGTAAPSIVPLSRREREVALLIAQGFSNRRIAERLNIGQRTAESHVSRLMKKLGCANRAQVMLWALAAFLPAANLGEPP